MSTTINPDRLGRRICEVAMRYNGLKEIKPNAKFDNPKTPGQDPEAVELLQMYREAGWEEGWSHCAAFVDGVVCKALRLEGATPDQVKKFTKLMQLGVMNSVRAFQGASMLRGVASLSTTMANLAPGSIWLARHGATPQGHTGIVLSYGRDMTISTIEANTSKDAAPGDKDREGDWITTKIFSAVGRGTLRTQGFVTPAAICKLINS